jgi:vesicle-associated membrane protein 72
MAGPSDQALIYGFVARGTLILADYTEFSGNFKEIAAQCLQKLPASNNKFTYTAEAYTFNYLVHDGYVYCVVATESAGRQIPVACLDRIKENFLKKYRGGKAATAQANGLKEFGSKIKEEMKYCMEHREELSKLARVQNQVDDIKGIMRENIDKVLNRGEQLEVLVDKTDNLRNQASEFRQTGTQVRRKMWIQNMKIKLIVLGIIIALILIIILSVCHGFKCT